MRVDREGQIQQSRDQTNHDREEVSLHNVINVGRVRAEHEGGKEAVHPVPDSHVPEEDPEKRLNSSVEKLVNYTELHFFSIVCLRFLEFLFSEKLRNIAIALVHFIAPQLPHIDKDFESTDGSECKQEVKEVREGRLVFLCNFVNGPVAS